MSKKKRLGGSERATVSFRWRARPDSVPPSFPGDSPDLVLCHRQFPVAC